MSLKDILVHVDLSKQCKHRLDVASRLARIFNAHLSGIYAIPDALTAAVATAEYFPADFVAEQQERERERSKEARAYFEQHLSNAGIVAEWRASTGILARVIARNARYCDLAILSQAEHSPETGVETLELPADVALAAGRPVLVVPSIGPPGNLGSNVLVAWNASREATRAVNDAMPLLQEAKEVTVLAVNPKRREDSHGEIPSADIALHLSRHGVKVVAAQMVAPDVEVGDIILSRASSLGANLIVSGAYGHSRLREYIFGGVTRHLLRHMTVPVLMSH
jgi:nucleotide-binding universal stress UspA family protein